MADADRVGVVLAALADPTRRQVFESVARDGPLTATRLARDLPVSRQAVTKHLERLAEAGLAAPARVGRETRWTASPDPLDHARQWFDEIGSAWDRRLDALTDVARRRAETREGHTSGD